MGCKKNKEEENKADTPTKFLPSTGKYISIVAWNKRPKVNCIIALLI